MVKNKVKPIVRRRKKIRSKVAGTSSRPRLSVFRSGKHIYAQIINDEKGTTLVGMTDISLKGKKTSTKSEKARVLGVALAELARKNNIKKVTFDRGGRAYHGRVRALAEGAREGGLEF